MVPVEFVSFEDCFNVTVSSEDEIIDRIDNPDDEEED